MAGRRDRSVQKGDWKIQSKSIIITFVDVHVKTGTTTLFQSFSPPFGIMAWSGRCLQAADDETLHADSAQACTLEHASGLAKGEIASKKHAGW